MATTDNDNRTKETMVEHHEVREHNDPHTAALVDNPPDAKLTWSVVLSALFLGTSFVGPIIFGFILIAPVLVQLSGEIGGATVAFWILSGWAAAATVLFSLAGRLSDIFGRRNVLLAGQLMTVIGAIVAATAKTMNQVIAGEVILGAALGTVSVAYAGMYYLKPTPLSSQY